MDHTLSKIVKNKRTEKPIHFSKRTTEKVTSYRFTPRIIFLLNLSTNSKENEHHSHSWDLFPKISTIQIEREINLNILKNCCSNL